MRSDRGLDAERLGAWSAALHGVGGHELRSGTLAQLRPPRWSWTTDAGVVLATLVEPGAGGIAIELPGSSTTWAGLTVLGSGEALSTGGALATGDRAFDGAVLVFANTVHAHGIFDAQTRALVRGLVDVGVVVLDGAVYLGPERAREVTAEAVAPLFASMLALRDRLARLDHEAASRCVIEMAADDPLASVRAHYSALARDPQFAPYVVERDVHDDQGDASFETLAAHASNPGLQFGLRRAALQRLIAEHPLMAVAAIRHVPWRELADYEDIEVGLAQATRSAREGAAEGGLLIARLMFHLTVRTPPIVARALAETLPYELSYHGRRGLFELTAHPEGAIARIARQRYVASFASFEQLAEALDDSPTLSDLASSAALSHDVLAQTVKVFSARTRDEREEAAARHVVRRLVARLYDGDPVGQHLWGGAGQWPVAHLALPVVRSHRRTRDAEGRELLAGLLESDEEDVRREALAALMELPPDAKSLEAVTEHALAMEVYEAATVSVGGAPDHTPAYAVDYLVAAFPGGRAEAVQVRFVAAIGELGSAAQVPFLLGLLATAATAVVCEALAALGRHADSGAIAAIEPYTSGFFRDAEVKRAAKDAIRAIGERGAPAGSLSLAEGGGLAVADDD